MEDFRTLELSKLDFIQISLFNIVSFVSLEETYYSRITDLCKALIIFHMILSSSLRPSALRKCYLFAKNIHLKIGIALLAK